MDKILEAVKEASISVACLLDDIPTDTNTYKDIVHIQNQITIIENYLDLFVVEELWKWWGGYKWGQQQDRLHMRV